MNIVAFIIFLLIGFVFDWGDAFFFVTGYIIALLVVGKMIAKGEL